MEPDGNLHDCFPAFEEGAREYQLEEVISKVVKVQVSNGYSNLSDIYRIELIHNALVFGIKDYFSKMGFKRATLGLSGGIDSALTLVLASEALGPENLKVLLLPSKYSSDHSVSDSIELAENLGVSWEKIPIQQVVDGVEDQMKEMFEGLPADVTEENIQARVRGVFLMALSNKLGHILLNTSNKSEAAVGYATLYGDMNGGLSVLGDVYKTDVYLISKYINREKKIIPYNIIYKEPSAELRPDQKDSDSLPDYSILDKLLYRFIEMKETRKDIVEAGFEEEMVDKIISLVNKTEYKRFQSPPILRVSSKAFGIGRRIPLVAKY